MNIINEPVRAMFLLVALSSNEGSDESMPTHSLTRTFAARIHRVWTSMWINIQTGDLHLKIMTSLQPSENCKGYFHPHSSYKSKVNRT